MKILPVSLATGILIFGAGISANASVAFPRHLTLAIEIVNNTVGDLGLVSEGKIWNADYVGDLPGDVSGSGEVFKVKQLLAGAPFGGELTYEAPVGAYSCHFWYSVNEVGYVQASADTPMETADPRCKVKYTVDGEHAKVFFEMDR